MEQEYQILKEADNTVVVKGALNVDNILSISETIWDYATVPLIVHAENPTEIDITFYQLMSYLKKKEKVKKVVFTIDDELFQHAILLGVSELFEFNTKK